MDNPSPMKNLGYVSSSSSKDIIRIQTQKWKENNMQIPCKYHGNTMEIHANTMEIKNIFNSKDQSHPHKIIDKLQVF